MGKEGFLPQHMMSFGEGSVHYFTLTLIWQALQIFYMFRSENKHSDFNYFLLTSVISDMKGWLPMSAIIMKSFKRYIVIYSSFNDLFFDESFNEYLFC